MLLLYRDNHFLAYFLLLHPQNIGPLCPNRKFYEVSQCCLALKRLLVLFPMLLFALPTIFPSYSLGYDPFVMIYYCSMYLVAYGTRLCPRIALTL